MSGEVPYFDLFNGHEVAMSDIKRTNPLMELSVQTMIDTGKAIGQGTFNEEMQTDILVHIPNRGTIFNAKQGGE